MLTFDLRKVSKRDRRAILSREGVDLVGATAKVRPIVEAVRAEGDLAVRRFAETFDGMRGGPLTLSRKTIGSARGRVPRELLQSMAISKRRIEAFHKRQALSEFEFKDDCGYLGQKVVPLSRVGVYVPGGSADYLSTVLMACVPARIAGVREVVLCTPGREGSVPDSILAAAEMCGVSEVHPIGGAHSIAAMAYGTESIPKVQKIVGPGGAYVTAAKLLVRNDCEIDFLAGPSEVLIIADAYSDPGFIAADMLAQLEHDPLARAVLVTTSEKTASGVNRELERRLASSDRVKVASKAAEKGAIFLTTGSISDAIAFSNEYAPEHLLVDVRNPKAVLPRIRNAGSVFLGCYSSVPFGDYCSGTNHILPTKGVASMKSALSVYDFLKIIPYQGISRDGAVKLAGIVDTLARAEGLPAHADAAMARVRRKKG